MLQAAVRPAMSACRTAHRSRAMNGFAKKLRPALRSKARDERFWIELNSVYRNSCGDSIHGTIQLCALLPVSQKALHRHDPEQPITNAQRTGICP